MALCGHRAADPSSGSVASPSSGLFFPVIRLGDPRLGPQWPPRGRSVEWIRGQPVEWASSRDPSGGPAAWPPPARPMRRVDLWPARRVGLFSGSVEGIRGMALGGPRMADPSSGSLASPSSGLILGIRLGDPRHGPWWPSAAVSSSGSLACPPCGLLLGIRRWGLRLGPWRPSLVLSVAWRPAPVPVSRGASRSSPKRFQSHRLLRAGVLLRIVRAYGGRGQFR